MHLVDSTERHRALEKAEERAVELAGLAQAVVELAEDGIGGEISAERAKAAWTVNRLALGTPCRLAKGTPLSRG